MTKAAVNLLGFLSDPRGVGQVAAGFRRSLKHLGIASYEFDISDMAENLSAIAPRSVESCGYLNLAVVNPHELAWCSEKYGPELLRDRYTIANWWWELGGSLPNAWKLAAETVDEIWAGSTFQQEVFAQNFQVPVRLVPPVIALRTTVDYPRKHFGWNENEYVFLNMCDFKSRAERKNPLALIKAFKAAFAPSEAVRLVVKVSSANSQPDHWNQLVKESAQYGNISLIDAIMPRAEIDAMLSNCDCYASLHRGEGLGLTLAESMLSGKPVVATGWSGNMDYMDSENSYPISYKLVELPEDFAPYLKGQIWAEPDLEHAAVSMRRVYENRDEAQLKAEKGQQTIQRMYSLEAVSQAVADRIESLAPVATVLGRLERRKRQHALASDTTGGELKRRGTSVSNGSVVRADMPDVSVCLPVFNGERYLAEAIESVLNQSHENFELLISNDQSTDGSLNIIERYASQDKRIRHWSNTERIGLFPNYNRCIAEAGGKYIKLFAQDDVLEPSVLQETMRILDCYPNVSLVSTDKDFINELGQSIRPEDYEFLAERAFPKNVVISGENAIFRCLFPVVNLIGEPCAVLFRREQAGVGFDERFHHIGDMEYWFSLLLKGNYYHIGKPLCRFRRHNESASTRNLKSLLFATDTLKLGRKFQHVLEKFGVSSEEFTHEALEALSIQTTRLSDRDLYAGQLAIDRTCNYVDPKEFQELAFRALQYASGKALERKTEQNLLIARMDHITCLEQEIRELLGSIYWRSTRPLREAKRAVLRSAQLPALSESFEVDDRLFSEQADYVRYLEELREAIMNSLSWRLTAPARMASRLLGSSQVNDFAN